MSAALNAVAQEMRKMRRLHTIPVVLVLVGALVAFSSMSFFGQSARLLRDDPSKWPWASALYGVVMVNALIQPILVAVIASRQVDVEHTGGGWTLNATLGRTPGAVCRTKLVVIAGLLGPALAVQMLATLAVGVASGVSVPIDWPQWTAFFVSVWAVDVALAAGHIWLSARFENQLVSMGVGVLGAFAAVYLLLAPTAVARWIPWGAYAMTAPVVFESMEAGGVRYASIDVWWLAGFLILAAAAFTVGTRRMDRMERNH